MAELESYDSTSTGNDASRVGASTALSSDTNLGDVISHWLEVSVVVARRPASRRGLDPPEPGVGQAGAWGRGRPRPGVVGKERP